MYRAFLSYSHALDGRLTPAVQSALQRFGKPWYRMRAFKVFRDQTSLSASPQLWTNIEVALSSSEYFILLASPQAAESYWVQREVAYWTQRDTRGEKVLIILTSGEIVWDREKQDFLWPTTTSIPRTLCGVFTNEPLFVDLRWARSEEHLSVRHPRFQDAIATVAASLHGVPKDELAGEEVRQHRRTLKVVWSVSAALLVLTILAVSFAIRSEMQRREAVSRQLAVTADTYRENQLDLALLLSLEALKTGRTIEARSSLLADLSYRSHLATLLRGHENSVPSVALSPDGTVLASAGWDDKIVLWDVGTRQRIGRPLLGHSDWVQSVLFTPDGRALISVGSDKTLRRWDLTTFQGEVLQAYKEPLTHLSITADGKYLAVGSFGSGIVLWDVASGKTIPSSLTSGKGVVRALAFSPSGSILAYAFDKGDIVLWDMKVGRLLARLPRSHSKSISSVRFSPDGTILVSAGDDGMLVFWDVKSRSNIGQPVVAHRAEINGIAFNPSGNVLASASSDKTIGLWDVRSHEHVRSLEAHTQAVMSVQFVRNNILASGGQDHLVLLWDVDQPYAIGRAFASDSDEPALSLNPSGDTAASSGKDGQIVLWSVGRVLQKSQVLQGHRAQVSSVTFSHDGSLLASGSWDNTVRLWNPGSGKAVSGALVGHSKPVSAVVFSPDSKLLASAGWDNVIRIWDVRAQRTLGRPLTGHTEPIHSLQFGPDGRVLVSAGADGKIIFWDPKSRSQSGSALTRRSSGRGEDLRRASQVFSLAFSPSGTLLASGDYDHNVLLWELPARRLIDPPLAGHDDIIQAVAFSPSGELIASGGDDQTIRLWDVSGERAFGGILRGEQGRVGALAFDPRGGFLASAGARGVTFWDLRLDTWRDQACRLANRNFTQAEWQRLIGGSYRCTCPSLPGPDRRPCVE